MSVISDIGKSKSYFVQALVVSVFIIYIIRLLYLQVINNDYKELAADRAFRKVTVYPDRGPVYDRNGKLIVYNKPNYNLMVLTSQVKNLDTLGFCELVGLDKTTFDKYMKKIKQQKGYSPLLPAVFMSNLSGTDLGRIEELLYQFPGFFPEIRTVRQYEYPAAAHILGYVTEVDSIDIKNSLGYYKSGDVIGKSGVEKSYEKLLRGEKGYKYMVVDAYNRVVGSLGKGDNDKIATAGKTLALTIDIELQYYAEQLMQNKRGAIVAIEPATGEILCMVSSPSYDPNLLTGSDRTKNFGKLVMDPQRPLNNRALTGYYPPGSTFKPVLAAIGMNAGTLTSGQGYSCPGGYVMSGHKVDCHNHPYAGNVVLGIGNSCNAYFCYVFKHFMEDAHTSSSAGLVDFKNNLALFGVGVRTGVDLPNERAGNVPDPEDYDKIYGEGRWRASSCITLGIGQDQLILTPLQVANTMATIANSGYFYTPHILKNAENADSILQSFTIKHQTGFNDTIWSYIQNGMAGAVNFGTAKIARIDSIQVCGKTGTAENPHGKSHSWFSCFAPQENPKIAIGIIVENSGWGASYAAPIASLITEKYLTGKISEKRKVLEKKMMDADLINEPKPEKIPAVDSARIQMVHAAILPKE
ncbi:MAG: penicillin-binding protein 2 [Chitinophagales bacterium]|nr:penicillin-binding protein 2 [Chitinophagales bacterium]